MIESFPLDYMHLTCLGVMLKLLNTWNNGPLKTRLGFKSMSRISDRLGFISNAVPVEFSRKPRSLKELPRWKATELRQFLMYTGPVVLKGILDDELFNQFLTFHLAFRILANPSTVQDDAKKLINFVENGKILYNKVCCLTTYTTSFA